MKRGMIIIIFAVTLLVLGGCGTKDPKSEGPFFGGNHGVSIKFAEDAPLSQFGELDTVPVSVNLENEGESDIPTGEAKIKLFGFDYEHFGLSNDFLYNTKPLRKRSELSPEGGVQELEIGRAKYRFKIRNSEEFTFRAKICYPYKTETAVDVCLSSKLDEGGGITICSVDGEKVKKGTVSSGPIQVTSITESLRSADQTRFDIKISNVGTGDVYTPSVSCEDAEDDLTRRRERNKIDVEVSKPTGMTCNFLDSDSNKGTIQLDDTGSATLTCWTTVKDTLKSKMEVTLSYRYVDRAEKTVTIFESN